jgi:hypothetical protein
MTDIAARLARSWCPIHQRPPSLVAMRFVHVPPARAIALEIRGCCANALVAARMSFADLSVETPEMTATVERPPQTR